MRDNLRPGRGLRSEREDDVDQLVAVTGLLHVAELAVPAIGYPQFGDLFMGDRVLVGDVLRPDHAGELDLADLVSSPPCQYQ
jgi:hypothetical protein